VRVPIPPPTCPYNHVHECEPDLFSGAHSLLLRKKNIRNSEKRSLRVVAHGVQRQSISTFYSQCPRKELNACPSLGSPSRSQHHHTTPGVQSRIFDRHLARLGDYCPRLRSLTCASSSLTFKCSASLAQLTHLTKINLMGQTDVDDSFIVKMVLSCPRLRDVTIKGSKHVTNLGVICLAENLPNLERVNLDGCDQVDDSGIQYLAARLKAQLTAISCSTNYRSQGPKMCDLTLVWLSRWCPNLLEVTFRQADGITDAGVKALALGCPRLTRVAITACSHLTDECVIAVASSCPNLRIVELHHCPLLTNNAVVAVAERCRSVTAMAFAGCPQITDLAVKRVAVLCPQLEIFAFQECPLLTDDGVCALRNCPQLRTVYVTGCPLVTSLSGRTLSQHCRQLGRRLHEKECGVQVPGFHFHFQSLADRIALERR
jgi:hypothetical protein